MLQTIKAVPQTFFSRSFYFDLVHRWKGIGLGFVLLLVLFNYAVPMLVHIPLIKAFQQETVLFFEKMPDIAIEKGKLSTDTSPFYTVDFNLKLDGNEEKVFAVMFDTGFTSSDISALDKYMAEKKVNALVTADYLAINKAAGSVEIHKFTESKKESFAIGHDQWSAFGKKLAFLLPFFLAFGLVFLYAVLLFVTFLKALLVTLFALFFKLESGFPAAMRLAAAAAIPPSLVYFALLLVDGSYAGRFDGAPGFLFWAAMAIFGLWCASKTGETEPGQESR